MNFIYYGDFSQYWSTETYIANELVKQGHLVRLIQESLSSDQLIRRVGKYGVLPDTVFLFCKCRVNDVEFPHEPEKTAAVLQEIKEQYNVKLVSWIFDPFFPEYILSRFNWGITVGKVCNHVFTTDGNSPKRFDFGNVTILRQGWPSNGRGPRTYKSKEYDCDLAFIGSLYGPRTEWATYYRSHFGAKFKIHKNVRGSDLYSACAGAKIVIGPGWPQRDYYWSNRIYVMTGYGGCFATPYVKGMEDEGWQHGVNYYDIPDDPEKAEPLLRKLLDDEPLRQEISRAGQELTVSRYTYAHRVAEMVRVLQES